MSIALGKEIEYPLQNVSGNEQHYSMRDGEKKMHMKCMKCNGISALCKFQKIETISRKLL